MELRVLFADVMGRVRFTLVFFCVDKLDVWMIADTARAMIE
jgi:hypothetical protein